MLAIRNLKAGYKGKIVVDLPDLSLAAGEHCLLSGRSGSGKTTLLYTIAGLLSPIAGEIHAPRPVGMIYQTLHMVPALSARDNILLAPYAAGMAQDEKKADALLSRLGLEGYAERMPHSLSHGQLQRVAIARAAMNDPALILADEPTSALDDDACATVMQLLLDTAKASHASLIVATHDSRINTYFGRQVNL
jgi:putative ABC transport system ATP-binding protein